MIARLPGRIEAGTVNDTPSYFADWFPTLCDAEGFSMPEGLDGNSLWPMLSGKQKTLDARRPMIWVFPEYGGQVAVRLGQFKLVRQGLKTKTPGPWEVYDLAADHSESHDIASGHAGAIAQAEELLAREVDDNRVFPLSLSPVAAAKR
jgi:arylsulfatase A-like enzyme